ncbi:hypothetical protein [Arthrobacter sp. HY1533]|uniref:hypothetical protein n=1 Tax=Arthrobacter sp. HY1533 TaxID=2970919 RepID=UPI0022B9F3B5|nr:hypothetical protein [Arthrobacter sp. HY1533]
MPRKKAEEETPETTPVAAVEPAPVPEAVADPAAATGADSAPDTAPPEPWEESGDGEPAPAEPVPEELPEPEPERVGFTSVNDPYSPAQDVVVRYKLPEVVTVTASWLSEAEAKVLRAQHQPAVDAANTVPEIKAADPKE